LLSLDARLRQRLAMLGVRIRMGLVAIGLSGLGEQDERCGVRGLQAEREVQQDEGEDVESRETGAVQRDPDGDQDRLPDQECRRSEEAGEALGAHPEPVVAERRGQMRVWLVKAEVTLRRLRRLARKARV